MLARCPKSAETNIDQDINNLKEKWESVETKLNERKVCALINVIESVLFHRFCFYFRVELSRIELSVICVSRMLLKTVFYFKRLV